MRKSFLLDSNVLIYVLQSRQPVVDLLHQLVDEEEQERLALSALTVYEVLTGTPQAEELAVTEFLGSFEVIPVTGPIAARGALLSQWLRSRGQKPAVADTLIAATALAEDRTLVTYDVSHFRRLGVALYPDLPTLEA